MTNALSGAGGSYDLSLLPYDGIEDLVNADPDTIQQFTSGYQQMAEAAQQAAQGLRGSTATYTWEGDAADAFRSTVKKVPASLDTVSTSMGAAGEALASYGPETEDAQNRIFSLLGQLQSAKAAQQAAQSALSSAKSAMDSANNAVSNPPSGQTKAEAKTASDNANTATSNYGSAQTTASNADGDFTRLQSQGKGILSDWTAKRTAAASAVKAAGDHAPHQSWLDSVLHGFVDGLKDVGNFALDVVKGIGETFIHAAELPDAIANVVMHPGSLKNWEALGTDVVAAGTVVLMATGVGETLAAADGVAVAGEAVAEGATEDAAESAASDAAQDAAQSTTEDTAATETKNFAQTQAEKFMKNPLKNSLAAENYGKQAYEAGDDAVHGRWGEMGTDLAEDAVGDAAGSYLDHGSVAGHQFGGEDFKGLDSMTGSEAAQTEGKAVSSFADRVDGGASNQSAWQQLNEKQQSSLLKAAGVPSGTMSEGAAKDQFINSLNTSALRQSAAHNIVHTGLSTTAADQVIDQTKDTAVDHINHALGYGG